VVDSVMGDRSLQLMMEHLMGNDANGDGGDGDDDDDGVLIFSEP
jgi:hypothetical protein